MNCKFIIIKFIIFTIGCLSVRALDQVSVVKDGLLLRVHWGKDQNLEKSPVVVCEITNTTDTPIDHMVTTKALGFDLRLLTTDGREIPQEDLWSRINEAQPRFDGPVRNSLRPIPSGKTVRREVDLAEAYGERWVDGRQLIVTWHPGTALSGYKLTTGDGISVTVEVPQVNHGDASKKGETREPASEGNSVSTTRESLMQNPPIGTSSFPTKEASESSNPKFINNIREKRYVMIFIATITIIIISAIALFLKKSKKQQ